MSMDDPAVADAMEGPATIAEASLPARPQAALVVLLDLFSRPFLVTLGPVLDEFEQQLFRLAEQARSGEAQKRCFESLREIRRGRERISPGAVARLERALAGILGPAQVPEFAEAATVASSNPTHVLLANLARKSELRSTQLLYPLCQRLGVIAGSPAFSDESLPIGPYWLLECLRVGIDGVPLHDEHVEHLLRLIERDWLSELPALYDNANAHLAEARILPNLPGGRDSRSRPSGPARPLHTAHEARVVQVARPAAPTMPASPAPRAPTAAPAPLPAAPPKPLLELVPLDAEGERARKERVGNDADRIGGPTGRPAPTATTAATPFLVDGAPDLEPFNRPLVGWPIPGTPPAGLTPESDTSDLDLYDRLRDLAVAYRNRRRSEAPSGHLARSEDVQVVLGILQKRPIPPIVIGGRLMPRTLEHVKLDLVNNLREFTPDGRPPRLADADADTLEMVGMLFEELGRRTAVENPGHMLLTRLQIPVLREALADKRFFTRRLFPSRLLLNAVVETALDWSSDEPEDKAAAEKVALLVDRAIVEYRGDSALFTELHSDFMKHQQTLVRKAEVAERRHVEAARGRERLDTARRSAAEAIGARVTGITAGGMVRTLLEQAWTDVLALTLLRSGDNSPAYLTRLAVADRLIEALGPSSAGHAPPDAATREFLRHELESGLAQVGAHNEDIQRLMERLFAPGTTTSDAYTADLAVILKARTRLGAESVSSLAASFAQPRTDGPPSARELVLVEKIKALPAGTWLDLVHGPQGEIVRRKLAWSSGLTDRCLLVNLRGGRVDEPPLSWLAREFVRGSARVVGTEADAPVDRALHAVHDRLRGAGTGAQP